MFPWVKCFEALKSLDYHNVARNGKRDGYESRKKVKDDSMVKS
nr:MAG TPA: hypothetical protein [Caudoviricetes sp.]